MEPKKTLLDWKKSFLQRIADRTDKQELEQRFEECVENLAPAETEGTLEYLELWKNCSTDSEKFYFSKKIVDALIQKK